MYTACLFDPNLVCIIAFSPLAECDSTVGRYPRVPVRIREVVQLDVHGVSEERVRRPNAVLNVPFDMQHAWLI